MTRRISASLVLLSGFLLAAGCVDAKQDQTEIPATIGQVQEADPQDSVPPANKTGLGEQQLESAKPGKQDLATLLRKENEEFEKQSIDIPSSWTRLGKNHIWADKDKKQVIVRGAICIDEGLLEMLACPRKTKEHEAIISVHAKAWEAHATLLALGINPGAPMIWREEYFPVSGPVMNIEIWWAGKDGQLVKRRAQDMIRNTDTGKAMQAEFVFGGSVQIFDPHEKVNDYMADFGPMINVANQPDAMIDISVQSSASEQGSLFEAFTENVPPVNTKVYIVLSASGKIAEPKDGKPTLEELKKQDELRRAAREKAREEEENARKKAMDQSGSTQDQD